MLVLIAAAGASGCLWRLFPEPYAVNTPVLHFLLGTSAGAPDAEALEQRIRVPEGFAVAVYADGLARPRFLGFTPAGDLLVSQPNDGRILLLERDANGDGRADGERVLLDGLAWPHGFDVHDGWLYVAQSESLVRIRFDAEGGEVHGPLETLAPLPEGVGHWYRNVRIGPDGRAYVTVGSSCNVCEEEDPRHATMLRFALDGSEEETVARGLRNAEGFDWQPVSGEIYATEAGRDFLGDDFPPEELNRIVPGGFYGWPYANGENVPDPDFGEGNEAVIATALLPAHQFPAHTTPLGITFLRDSSWPEDYRHAALVALHGSWNRNRKQGYEVVSLHWKEDGRIEERAFLSGFLREDDVIGRPVDVAEGPDGAAYVSDDHAGAIYRVYPGEGEGALRIASGPPSAAPAAVDPLAGLSERERRALVEEGAALFMQWECARCHDPERRAPGVVTLPLSNLAARWNVDGLEAFLARPRPPMPTFPLGEPERRALAVYLLAER
ncbi:MAG: oxidoreductase [Deltaproteobacteria bacterium]|nr:oxidoreductase [Deltaproteobacteria bacterium]